MHGLLHSLMKERAPDESTSLLQAGSASPPTRSVELDVLRSSLAILVFISHSAMLFECPPCIAILQPPHLEGDQMKMLGGKFSVMAFYVLSGAVIARQYIATRSYGHLLLAVFKRVPRLALPVLAASIIACMLANVGAFDRVEDVQTQYGVGWWCNSGAQDGCWTSDWHDALMVAIPPFNGPFPAGVLWTLQAELVGSMFILGLAPAFAHISTIGDETVALFTSAGLHVLVMCTLILCSFCERRSPKVFAQFERLLKFEPTPKWEQLWRALFLFEAGFAFQQMQSIRPVSLQRGWLSGLLVLLSVGTVYVTPPHGLLNYQDIITIGGVLLVYGFLLLPAGMRANYNGKLLTAFGEISFGIYLLQGVILYSIGANIYFNLRNWHFGIAGAYWLSLAVCCSVLLPASYLFCIYVEKPLAIDAPVSLWKSIQVRIVNKWCDS